MFLFITVLETLVNSNLLLTADFFIGFDKSITVIQHDTAVFGWSITKRNLHRSRLKTSNYRTDAQHSY